jgi:hypothetical protein
VQRLVLAPALRGSALPRPPRGLRLLARLPWVRGLPVRLVALGIRRAHVEPG